MFEPKTYIKDESFDPIYRPVNRKFLLKSRVGPVFLIFAGIFLLVTQVVVPLAYFKTADTVAKPVSYSVLGLAAGFRDFEFGELNERKVLGDASEPNVPEFFYLTIPKLNIQSALVETNAPTLNPEKALGHYAGSALPGENGNSFIFGHSVLPFFYNPKNYKTIFSTLDNLEVGDEFYIEYNNNKLKYKVEGIHIKKPDDVNPLANVKPAFLNESTATLMTCVPPGTKINRLLVNGVLVR